MKSAIWVFIGMSVGTIPYVHGQDPVEERNDTAALELFEKRILPIFKSKQPSSCTECHLSGIDLKDYIHPRQETTFAALVKSGLVDTTHPDKSKILEFISRKPEKPNLITDKVRRQEYEAFRDWLRAAVKEPGILNAKLTQDLRGPDIPVEVIRHARSDRVLASFIDNVWNEVGRCAACHSPDRNQEKVKEHGEQISWIKLGDPQATMQHMLESSLIDSNKPEESLILTKPTLQVEHGGGQKMVVGDRTYKQFRRFIDDYAAMVNGKYRSKAELRDVGDEVAASSEIWLKLTGVPAEFDKMLMQVDLYRREGSGWSKHRWATSDRPVFGKGQLWQHSLSLTARRGSKRSEQMRNTPQLPAGRYLIKIYVDKERKLEKDFRAELEERDFVGEMELESRWPAGYQNMTVVQFPGVK